VWRKHVYDKADGSALLGKYTWQFRSGRRFPEPRAVLGVEASRRTRAAFLRTPSAQDGPQVHADVAGRGSPPDRRADASFERPAHLSGQELERADLPLPS